MWSMRQRETCDPKAMRIDIGQTGDLITGRPSIFYLMLSCWMIGMTLRVIIGDISLASQQREFDIEARFARILVFRIAPEHRLQLDLAAGECCPAIRGLSEFYARQRLVIAAYASPVVHASNQKLELRIFLVLFLLLKARQLQRLKRLGYPSQK